MTVSRRTVLTAALALAAGSGAAAAAEAKFTMEAFQAAQAAGRAILVEVHADWCPVCARQKPILSGLSAEPAFAGVLRLIVDFDTQKDVLRTFNVARQSTLIAFKGTTERARSVGDTNAASIRALVQSAVS